MKPGRPIHPSNGIGTAPNAATSPAGVEVSFDTGPNQTRQAAAKVVITNLEAVGGNALEVSFADGRDGRWFAIAPQTTLPLEIVIHRCRLRGKSGATAQYAIMAIVA